MFDWLNYVNVKEADGLFFVMRYKDQPVSLFETVGYQTREEAEELAKLLNDAHESGVDAMR